MLQKLREKMKSTQRGAIMVFFALLVPLFLGMIGFAIDAGFLYMQKAKLQDIADAAALAGAGHLNDGDKRESNATRAVKAFGGANGMQAKEGTNPNYIYLGDKVKENDAAVKDQLTDKNPWRIAQAIDTQMTDKDGKNRDHVRVIIWKRVPTFFIRFLFPNDEKYEYVVVKAMAAAEYVEGEAPVVSEGAKVFAGTYNSNFIYDKKTIVVKENEDFSIYAPASEFIPEKLPIVSNSVLYQHNDNKANMPDGWTMYCTSKTEWNLNDPKDKQEKEAVEKANSIYNTKSGIYTKRINDLLSDKQSYINREGNKRYIGKNLQGEFINNIQTGDNDIDLYVDGTQTKSWFAEYRAAIINETLKGVTRVNTLILGKNAYISTEGIKYGNIYNIAAENGFSIGGKNNYFNGLIYAPGTLRLGGYDNHFNETGKTEIFVVNELRIGDWDDAIEGTAWDGSKDIDFKYYLSGNNSSWHMYWGGNGTGSGSSSGSSSSDTASKSRVRLVI